MTLFVYSMEMHMEERDFIETLNLLKESSVKVNVKYALFNRIRRAEFRHFLIRTALLTPLVFVLLFEAIRFASRLRIFNFFVALLPFKQLLMNYPIISTLAYLLITSTLASILISTFIGGGEDFEVLLPPR
jgi:hypothetical protein